MQKLRDYRFDNLKCLLIFLVVFAHCIEWTGGELAKTLCIMIYTFHMPVFIFVSGYFAKFKTEKIFKLIGLYVVWQIIYRRFENFILKLNYPFHILKPDWILWYLFSMVIWTICLKVFDTENKTKARILFLISLVIALGVGFIKEIGPTYSLSRILVFFPFFLAGYYIRKFKLEFIYIKKENKKDILKVISIILTFILSAFFFGYTLSNLDKKPLLGAYPYEGEYYNIIFRLVQFIAATNMIYIFMNIIPNKEFKVITKIGQNTLWVYLIHGLFVLAEQHKLHIYKYGTYMNLVLAIFISVVILAVFGYIFPIIITKIKDLLNKNKFENQNN